METDISSTANWRLMNVNKHWFLDIDGKLKRLKMLDGSTEAHLDKDIIFGDYSMYQIYEENGEVMITEIEDIYQKNIPSGRQQDDTILSMHGGGDSVQNFGFMRDNTEQNEEMRRFAGKIDIKEIETNDPREKNFNLKKTEVPIYEYINKDDYSYDYLPIQYKEKMCDNVTDKKYDDDGDYACYTTFKGLTRDYAEGYKSKLISPHIYNKWTLNINKEEQTRGKLEIEKEGMTNKSGDPIEYAFPNVKTDTHIDKNASNKNADITAGFDATFLRGYTTGDDDKICFDPGDIITNIVPVNDDCWMGTTEKGGRTIFPANYVEVCQRRSLESSYKVEDATEIYNPRDDDEELDPFLCSGEVKSIKKLIESGKLPKQRILDEMCQIFGRKSEAITVTCKAICEHIKSKHVAIAYVWAAYTIENPQRITFVITLKQTLEDDKSTESVRLDKLITYSFAKRYAGDFSLEGHEVIKQQTSVSEGLDEESYQKLQSCISKHSEGLMKKHRFLSIISACSNRSKGFGASWTLIPEKCVVLYVQKKNYIPVDEEPFDKYYDGIAVDVREGAFIPFGRTAREKLDPVKMGCQIRGDLYNGQYVEGTLGCFIDHPQFGVCGLTCAHVILSPWELVLLKIIYSGSLKWPLHEMYKNIYQPADQNSSIGHTVQFIYKEGSSTKSGMELVLFKITDRQPKSANFPDTTIISASSVNNIKYDSWRICSTDRMNQKENLVIKFGSKTEFRHGTIMFDNTAVKNLDSYPLASGYAVIKLFKQIEVKTRTHGLAFADRGDSGALVFLVENNSQYSCIGIVEGGTTYGTVVVTPIVPILEELKVHCLKSFESETNLSYIDNQIQSMQCDLQSVRQDIKNIDNTLQTIAQSLRNNQQ